MAELPLVSVVSLTHNRAMNIGELLSVLQQQTYPRNRLEVIVVDNASTDGTAEMIRRDHPQVRLIETAENVQMVAYNLGFQASNGEYILVMDDDGLPGNPQWIADVVNRLQENPRLGIASCTVRMRDTGRIAHDSPQYDATAVADGGYPSPAYNGTGAGIRATALKEAGLYPWHFGLSYLELYLSTRMLAKGWQIRHFPDIEVWHSRNSLSNPPVLGYSAMRNYYWYVWELYPWPAVMIETFHQLATNLKWVMFRRVPLKTTLTALRDSLKGLRYACTQREPVSPETVRLLRDLRRCGNDHGMTPYWRPYTAAIDAGPTLDPASHV